MNHYDYCQIIRAKKHMYVNGKLCNFSSSKYYWSYKFCFIRKKILFRQVENKPIVLNSYDIAFDEIQ